MRLIVKAILDDEKVLKYRIKKTSLLQKVFKAISDASNTPLDLLRFTYKGQSLKGTDTILSSNMNVADDIVIHVLRTDSSSSEANEINIPQEPVADTNDTVMVEQTDCEDENQSTHVNDDVIAQQPEDETPPPTSLPGKENIEVDIIKEQICGNENPLKRKCDEKLEGSLTKVCKVEPLRKFKENNLLITNLIADVNQKKMTVDESLKKISELEVDVTNMDAMAVTHANDLNTLVERHRLAVVALKESNQNEINDLKEAHRKALNELIAEKNLFVDAQSQTIDLMKQAITAKFDNDLKQIEQKNKDEIETLKAANRKEINDKEESHQKSIAELRKNNNLVIQKVMAEKFQVIESQNQNFESVKKAFAEEKQRLINERNSIEKTHDENLNSLKKEMEDAITEMVHSHDIEIQAMKDSCQKQLNGKNHLKDDVINKLTTKCKELKESHQKEIVDLKALTATKADHEDDVGPEDFETINQLKKQLIEKSKFHNENVQSIIKKCEVKRIKCISELKCQHKTQAEADAIKLKCLSDEIEMLKKNCGKVERFKGQHDAERTELYREFEKNSMKNDKLHEYVVNQLKKTHECIVQELKQKLNQKLVGCEETMKELNEQKSSFETELKTSKENHIRTVTKLQSEIKKTKEINGKSAEELKRIKNSLLEFEKKTTELQNERMKFANEINRLRMNCEQPGEKQAILAEIDRLKRVEQSYNDVTEQNSILHNENHNLKNSHQQLDQSLTDKTKAFEEFKAFHRKITDQLQAERDGNMVNLNAKTVEIEKLKDMRRVEEDARNAAHQNEILSLIGRHQQDLELVRSEKERKIKESGGSQRTATPAALILPNVINGSSSNEQSDSENSSSFPSPIMVSSTQHKAEPKTRKCDICGSKARFVTSYSYCSPMCNMAYCLKKTNSDFLSQQQPHPPNPLQT